MIPQILCSHKNKNNNYFDQVLGLLFLAVEDEAFLDLEQPKYNYRAI